jgi:pilus assembly protein FimV
MKDSEIADLQKKLKDLQAKAAAPAASTPPKAVETTPAKPADTTAAKPADATAAKPDQKLTAKDIWGDLNGADKNAAKPAPAGASPTVPPAATAPTETGSTMPTAGTPPPATPATSTTAAGTSPPATAPAAGDTQAPAAAASTSPQPPAASASPPSADAGSSDASPTVKANPVKSAPPAKVIPLAPASEPFYRNQNVLLGGGAALLLVGLLALMRFMRKPKPAFALPDEDRAAGVSSSADDEELRLRDALQQNPGNTGASLELLRHYYSQGDAAKFEAAAETMHAHLLDPGAPEWDEVLAMGAVLAPNHPLFSAVATDATLDDAALHETMHEHETAAEHFDEFTYPAHAHVPDDDAHTHSGTFDVTPVTEPHAVHDESFDFDLPIQTEETMREPVVVHHEPEPLFTEAAAPTPVVERQDDVYVGEDAIGTKLDLAKAYLDMGDPEGAKSMLDEVLAEGNDSQRDEARKLLAEIR